MNVYFRQLYIRPGVSFPLSHVCNHYLSETITAVVVSSEAFNRKYGSDFSIVFTISAQQEIEYTQIKGPTVFKKAKDVEYSLFLPFDTIMLDTNVFPAAIRCLLDGVCSVLQSFDISTSGIDERRDAIIQRICADPSMFTNATKVTPIGTSRLSTNSVTS